MEPAKDTKNGVESKSSQLRSLINSGGDLLWMDKLSSFTKIIDFLSHLSHGYPP